MIRLDEIDQHKLEKDVMLIIDRIVVKPKKLEFYNRSTEEK
jgi:hypothetical protein